jgi:hypothetical protein
MARVFYFLFINPTVNNPPVINSVGLCQGALQA